MSPGPLFPVLVITGPNSSLGMAIQGEQDACEIACIYAEMVGAADPDQLRQMTFEVVPSTTVREAKGTVTT